ncbi:MAG: double-strand break repair protein AddB [Litoreibacter sp.]
MLEPSQRPSIYGVSLGVDYPRAVVEGLLTRLNTASPDALARVTIYVNTRRMARRLEELFVATGPILLPRIKLITDIGKDVRFTAGAPPADPLARRLELSQLVRALLAQDPDLAPQSAAFDLADSLADLMDEMQGEGVAPDVLSNVDVAQHSDHWARSLRFIELVQRYFATTDTADTEARQRLAVETLSAQWHAAPPQHPILVVGSTGSRATTRIFMQAVARLPQGAAILPGFDFEMPSDVWDGLDDRRTAEDHPQYRFKILMDELDLTRSDVQSWETSAPACVERNAVLSLALRPAPVTNAWLEEGPNLPDLAIATAGITLIEAPTPRIEAVTIAMGIRGALEKGQTVALITPDRVLTRQVTAALQRWSILPDDSAGLPLALSAPGRLLRQVAALLGARITAQDLLAILKHPLVATGSEGGRGSHLQNTRDLELEFLRGGPPFPDRAALLGWAMAHKTRSTELTLWITWIVERMEAMSHITQDTLVELTATHIALTEALCAGPNGVNAGELWEKNAGDAARKEMAKLSDAAHAGGDLSAREYRDLIGSIIAQGEVRNAATVHNDVMIWGTLEARVQGADLTIMAGLNDGVWPKSPDPDPWLNRQMREEAGLLLPERNIGLSAHDFQQAFCAPHVWVTRSVRNAEAETVPSRWLNRLRNLMEGLPDTGRPAYAAMKDRGETWLMLAQQLETPRETFPSEPRPAPQPPVSARPQNLSVTRIEKLIRDPYAIYASYILDLKPLRDLTASPDAPMSGQAIHSVLETFVRETADVLGPDPEVTLMQIADRIFAKEVPWAATRQMWRAKLARSARWFIETEQQRRQLGHPLQLKSRVMLEETITASMSKPPFTLQGRIDRVDQLNDGRLVIYDYKTGSLPTDKQQTHFNKQLPLLAALVLRGGIAGETGFQVAQTTYIGLGSNPRQNTLPQTDAELDAIWDELSDLITEYNDPNKGYASRRAVFATHYTQDYDHLARYGEWDETQDAQPIRVGQ